MTGLTDLRRMFVRGEWFLMWHAYAKPPRELQRPPCTSRHPWMVW